MVWLHHQALEKLSVANTNILMRRFLVKQWVSYLLMLPMFLMKDTNWTNEALLSEVLRKTCPDNRKTVKTKQTPFMNSLLRRAAYKKAMFFNNYNKWRTRVKWEVYRM